MSARTSPLSFALVGGFVNVLQFEYDRLASEPDPVPSSESLCRDLHAVLVALERLNESMVEHSQDCLWLEEVERDAKQAAQPAYDEYPDEGVHPCPYCGTAVDSALPCDPCSACEEAERQESPPRQCDGCGSFTRLGQYCPECVGQMLQAEDDAHRRASGPCRE